MTYTYDHAILGGTFDHFHAGHEKFISAAISGAKHITIGLVIKTLGVEKDYPSSIEPYSVREKSLQTFLSKNNASSRSTIIPLSDIFGTSLTDPSIQAIYVTKATYSNAERINAERANHGLPKLTIVTIDYVLGDDDIVVSSSRIRAGIIDRLGHSYLKYFMQKPTYHLPLSLRETLQTSLGITTTDLDTLSSILPSSPTIIAVGDIVSRDLFQSIYRPTICIIDHRTRRSDLDPNDSAKLFPLADHTLSNPQGTINPKIGDLILTSLSAFQKNKATQIIAVSGEEDLLALPALLLAPLGSYVVYGQYRVGMCLVQITPEIKSFANDLLSKFT